MIPDECASMRSIARWVLPVLVGPSTAVTPAPGARSLANPVVGEKAIFSGVSLWSVLCRHCEERGDEAIQNCARSSGLLRFARNDEIVLGFPGTIAADSVSDCD